MIKRTMIGASLTVGLLISAIALTPKKLVAAVVATLIRDQDAAARHPFSAYCQFTNYNGCSIPVPAGEEVVIQNVAFGGSAQLSNVNPGHWASFALVATSGGALVAPVGVIVPASAVPVYPSNNISQFGGTQTTWFAADPGTSLQIAIAAYPPTAQLPLAQGYCTVSGYYVTLP
jgi:hypothetical protein